MSGRGKRKKCRWCGAAFTARSSGARSCPECKAELNRVRCRQHWLKKTGKLANDGYRAAVAEAMRRAVEARRRLEAENRPRCRFCGNVHGVNGSGYCKPCRLAGLDDLHKATGRTNGWDRPAKPPRVAVEGGWRGRIDHRSPFLADNLTAEGRAYARELAAERRKRAEDANAI